MSYYDYGEYEPDEEEMEEFYSMADTNIERKAEMLKVEFNTENLAAGIVRAVSESLKAELKDEILAEMKKDILGELKAEINASVSKITEDLVREIYEVEVIKVGGGWQEEPKEYTVKQYIMEQIKNSFNGSNVKIRKKDRYGDYKTVEVSFSDWVTSECVSPEVQKYFDAQMKITRDEINKKLKAIFDESTRSMLSENVMSILLANDTYRKIQGNIASIASNVE